MTQPFDFTMDWRRRQMVSPDYPQNLIRPSWGGTGTPSAAPVFDKSTPAGAAAQAAKGLFGLGTLDAGVADMGMSSTERAVWFGVGALSGGLSAYHGYKRNRGSIGWTLGWFFLGSVFPVITVAVAVAQGYGKPAKRG